MRVLIFGDSIAYGEYDSRGGWANRLFVESLNRQAEDLDTEHPFVFNLSIGGETTAGIIKRLSAEVEARRWEDEDFAFVFAVGINDASMRDGFTVSSPDRFGQDLEALYELAKKYTKKMLFGGLTPVEDNSLPDDRFRSSRIWKFEQVLRQFAQQKKVLHVSLFESFAQKMEGGKVLTLDGLHPNDEGHQLIYVRVRPAFEDLIR